MEKSVKKNFVYNLLYQILTFLLPLITTPYLSRILGAEKTGVYSYAYSIAYYFVLFCMLGLNNYGNREIAKVRDDKYRLSKTFWSIYGLQLCTGVIVTVIYVIYIGAFRNQLISWIMLLYVVSALFDVNWFFWGLEEFKITVARNTIIKLLSVGCILLFVKSVEDIYIYAIIMTGSMLLSAAVLWPYLKGRVIWIKPRLSEILKHLKPNLILFIPVIAVSVYKIMDKIMLGNMSGYSEVGLYDYAEKVIAIPICCVNALGAVMLPRMSHLVATNNTEMEKDTVYKSLIIGTALSVAMSFGLIGIADVFVPVFYGEGYTKCIALFYVLLPSCVFLAIANVIRTQCLIPRSMDKGYTISLIFGAAINLLTNLLLIPVLQSVGAAIGTLIAEGVVCLTQVLLVRKHLPIKDYWKDILYLVAVGFVMSFAVYFIPIIFSGIFTLLIKICVGMIIFSTLMLIRYKALMTQLLHR